MKVSAPSLVLDRSSLCVICKRPIPDAYLWATDGSGLLPVHAECLTAVRRDEGGARERS